MWEKPAIRRAFSSRRRCLVRTVRGRSGAGGPQQGRPISLNAPRQVSAAPARANGRALVDR